MRKILSWSVVPMVVVFASSSGARSSDIETVLRHAGHLQKTRGYVSNHVEGGHTHFDIVARDGTPYEICPHPDEGLLHVMQGEALPGARLVIEINLNNDVYPYNGNFFTSFINSNQLSRSGLRFMANKATKTIMDTPQ